MLKSDIIHQPKFNNPSSVSEPSKIGLEEKVDEYKEQAINDIRFSIITKPAIISLVALFLSFFLDLSTVPLLGNITVSLAQILFPKWQPVTESFTPYSFWWLPVLIYFLYILLAYAAFTKLKKEVKRTPATETIDKIVSAYTTIIDSISMALPLIGAALLLISIKLGEEVFLGLSVPFEVKALIVLALGKLFEPVLDQLSLEFQNVVNHVTDMRDKYYSKLQVRNTQSIIKQLSIQQSNMATGKLPELSIKDLEAYKNVLSQTTQLSKELINNFNSIHAILEKINGMQSISSAKVEELKTLAHSISTASQSLSDERTLTGLKYLESIVVKK
jgi:HPt (histidine-containing phosphotransfer) domain-containing protein